MAIQEQDLSAAPDVTWRAAAHPESPLAQGMRRLRKSTTALIGAGIVAVLLVVALFADVLAPQSPIASDQTHTFERPSRDFPLGTDQLGRDMLSRIIHGSRISLAIGVSSVLLALFVGLGTQPPTPSSGWDLKANVSCIQSNPWISLFPGIAIFVTVLGFNLFGDGLRDALDPRLK